MQTKEQQCVILEYFPLTIKNKLKYRVTAKLGETVLYMHSFDIGTGPGRRSFLNAVKKSALNHVVDVDLAKMEEEILQLAHDAMLGLAEADGLVGGAENIHHSEVLEVFGITVLGENDDQSIRCWSQHTQKQFVIRSPANWKAAEVLQSVGTEVAGHLASEQDDSASDGVFTLNQIQRAVALAAAESTRFSSIEHVGQGIWPHGDGGANRGRG